MRKSALEKKIDLKKRKAKAQTLTVDQLMLLLLDDRGRKPEDRAANPTQALFIYDNHPFSLYMGPKGCAKTSTIACAGMMRALLQPGSKGLVARRDYNDLKQTTKLRMQEMLNRLPDGTLLDRSKDPPEVWVLQPIPQPLPDGTLDDAPSTVTFMGLESLDEGGGYEFDWAIIDEATECDERSIHAVDGLLRNMPVSWQGNSDGRYRTMLACNPPDVNHWIYQAVTGKDHTGRDVRKPWMKLFLPQPNENQRNLPSDYYQRLAATLPEDMRRRLVEGQWGSTFVGQPVFPQFHYPVHAVFKLIDKFDPNKVLLRFWDFGFHRPYCVFCQIDHEGRLLGFHEIMGHDEEIETFVHKVKSQGSALFAGHKDFLDFGDPAAKQQKDTGSTLTRLNSMGIKLKFRTTTIDPGLAAIRLWLERTIAKEPALQFDQQGCSILIRALQGGYHYDAEPFEIKGDHKLKPVKDGYYDHPVDAYRYGIVNLFGVVTMKEVNRNLPAYLGHDPNYGSEEE